MKTFRRRSQEIYAIKFEYSDKGMQELREFCKPKNIRFTKERHPHSIAQAAIYDVDSPSTPRIIWENHWLVKLPDGAFVSYTDRSLKELYEEVYTPVGLMPA